VLLGTEISQFINFRQEKIPRDSNMHQNVNESKLTKFKDEIRGYFIIALNPIICIWREIILNICYLRVDQW